MDRGKDGQKMSYHNMFSLQKKEIEDVTLMVLGLLSSPPVFWMEGWIEG